MPNLMQGHCRRVLKVSEQSTSVEKFAEALDNDTPPLLPAVLKPPPCQQLRRSPQTNRDFGAPAASAHDEREPSANVIVATGTSEVIGACALNALDGRLIWRLEMTTLIHEEREVTTRTMTKTEPLKWLLAF